MLGTPRTPLFYSSVCFHFSQTWMGRNNIIKEFPRLQGLVEVKVSFGFLKNCDVQHLKSSLTCGSLVFYKVSRLTVVIVICFICMDSYVEICEIIVAFTKQTSVTEQRRLKSIMVTTSDFNTRNINVFAFSVFNYLQVNQRRA